MPRGRNEAMIDREAQPTLGLDNVADVERKLYLVLSIVRVRLERVVRAIASSKKLSAWLSARGKVAIVEASAASDYGYLSTRCAHFECVSPAK